MKFCNRVRIFLKTRKEFRINTTGFNSEHKKRSELGVVTLPEIMTVLP